MFGCLVRALSARHLVFAASVVALAAGCGGGKSYQFHPVKGRVLHAGKPVTGGTIQFTNPDDSNFVASSPIGADGAFTLQTSTTNPARTSPGAPTGKYQVLVAMPAVPPSKTFASMTAPENYTIVPGENDLTIKLP